MLREALADGAIIKMATQDLPIIGNSEFDLTIGVEPDRTPILAAQALAEAPRPHRVNFL